MYISRDKPTSMMSESGQTLILPTGPTPHLCVQRRLKNTEIIKLLEWLVEIPTSSRGVCKPWPS